VGSNGCTLRPNYPIRSTVAFAFFVAVHHKSLGVFIEEFAQDLVFDLFFAEAIRLAAARHANCATGKRPRLELVEDFMPNLDEKFAAISGA
jgi:hypothetical protein